MPGSLSILSPSPPPFVLPLNPAPSPLIGFTLFIKLSPAPNANNTLVGIFKVILSPLIPHLLNSPIISVVSIITSHLQPVPLLGLAKMFINSTASIPRIHPKANSTSGLVTGLSSSISLSTLPKLNGRL